jgi:hypothetical protein
MVFLSVPVGVPGGAETGMVTVHEPGFATVPAGMVPPVKVTEVAVVEIVPPQVVVTVPATVKGAGKLSVKVTPVYGVFVGFRNVTVRVVVPPA